MSDQQHLLKELKKAYKYYVEDDIMSFNNTLEGLVLAFSDDPNKIAERIRKFLSGR